MPTVWPIAARPPTVPRCGAGTRSGMAAVMAAYAPLQPACTRHQRTVMTATPGAPASAIRAAAPRTAPKSTHGTRRPRRAVVRSLKAPKRGLATRDTAAPAPVTRARMASWSGSLKAAACWPRSTWSGPKNAALMPTLTSTTPAVQTGRTRRSGSASAGAVVSDMLMAPPGTDDQAYVSVRSQTTGTRRIWAQCASLGHETRCQPALPRHPVNTQGVTVNASAMNTADLYDERGGELESVSVQFQSLGGHTHFSGPVRTIRCFEDNALVKSVLATPGHGSVLVVDGAGSLRTALMGDMIAASAVANGWAGVVINGAIRDRLAIAGLPLGVKALGSNPRKSAKDEIGRAHV